MHRLCKEPGFIFKELKSFMQGRGVIRLGVRKIILEECVGEVDGVTEEAVGLGQKICPITPKSLPPLPILLVSVPATRTRDLQGRIWLHQTPPLEKIAS